MLLVIWGKCEWDGKGGGVLNCRPLDSPRVGIRGSASFCRRSRKSSRCREVARRVVLGWRAALGVAALSAGAVLLGAAETCPGVGRSSRVPPLRCAAPGKIGTLQERRSSGWPPHG